MKEKDTDNLTREARDFFLEVVTHLMPAAQAKIDKYATAGDILAVAKQAIADATPEQLEGMRDELSRFLRWLDECGKKANMALFFDEREVQRVTYIAACRDLAAPLKRFLNHPWVDEKQAELISDAVNRIFNADPLATLATQGDSAANELLEMASGHERVYEPEWAEPLGHYIQQALSDRRTPVELHNGLVDACDTVMEPPGGSAADDVRRRFVDCLTRRIAKDHTE